MKASNLFVLEGELPSDFELTNQRSRHTEVVNGVEETLTTQLFINEITVNNYTHCRMVIDELVDVQARALNQNIEQIIVQNAYEIYFDNNTGKLISLSNKKVADRAKEIFESSFSLQYLKFGFDLTEIINNSSNVKGAKFKNLSIQTINGGQLNGNNVNQTDIYDLMLQNGDLSTIVVTYPFGTSDVSFSISNSGSLVLYSTLNDAEYIDLLDELLNL